ncbi:hypothetical protein ACFXDP_09425 [Streptomyces sp. NPDC059374]|uniref:hypothetical protein n=1 Tax=Streptomyces sp. NPDC059374 TaxID=3346814 RepID=UPI0036BA5223
MRTTGLLGVLVMGLVAGGGTGVALGAEAARPAQGPTAALRGSPSPDPSAGEPEGPGSGRPSAPSSSGKPSATPSRHGEHGEHHRPGGREEPRDREEVRETWHSGRHEPSPSASAHGPAAGRTKPSDEPSRAGSRPGEGRERPGRQKVPLEESEAAVRPAGDRDDTAPPADEEDTAAVPDDEATAGATAPPSGRAADDAQGAGTRERAQQPVLQVLPLGMGLVLVGLGLGLTFVGLRLRRG